MGKKKDKIKKLKAKISDLKKENEILRGKRVLLDEILDAMNNETRWYQHETRVYD